MSREGGLLPAQGRRSESFPREGGSELLDSSVMECGEGGPESTEGQRQLEGHPLDVGTCLFWAPCQFPQGHRVTGRRPRGLPAQRSILSQVWELEVQDQGVSGPRQLQRLWEPMSTCPSACAQTPSSVRTPVLSGRATLTTSDQLDDICRDPFPNKVASTGWGLGTPTYSGGHRATQHTLFSKGRQELKPSRVGTRL